MSNGDIKKAYDEDLKKYGYVKQTTINRFASQQDFIPNKVSYGTTYLHKLHDDISEYGFIRNDTVNTITGYVPPKLKKEKKKKVVKIKKKQTTKRWCKDSDIYHKIFKEHYGDLRYCMRCGSTKRLQIHHKDKNHKNNDISNLIMLCYGCHCIAHEGDKVHKLMIKHL